VIVPVASGLEAGVVEERRALGLARCTYCSCSTKFEHGCAALVASRAVCLS